MGGEKLGAWTKKPDHSGRYLDRLGDNLDRPGDYPDRPRGYSDHDSFYPEPRGYYPAWHVKNFFGPKNVWIKKFWWKEILRQKCFGSK